jgi:hypothetical protein
MADHFCGLNKGQGGLQDSDFTIGVSSGGVDVEVRVADAAGLDRLDVINILDAISNRLKMGGLTDILTSARV